MDHAEIREQLELAALEPGGLDRLAAGDTAAAAAVAAHLAGCAECADELDRLRRGAVLVRDVIRTTPPADLRERTLGYVRAVGRDRTGGASGPVSIVNPVPSSGGADRERPTRGRRGRPSSLVGLAAAVLVAVVGTGTIAGLVAQRALDERNAEIARQDDVVEALAAEIARQDDVVEALATVTAWSLRVSGEEDSRTVRLASTSGAPASGTILFSPSTRELVVVADDLAEPPAGSEFRCWVEVDGSRRPVGRMFFGGGLSYWVGDVEAIAGLTGGATFGISLADTTGSGTGAEPVLLGGL